MPVFTNTVPLDDQTQRASHEAGIAIIRAIQEAFYGLEAYEFAAVGQPLLAITRFRSAAKMFEHTSYLYGRLAEMVPEKLLGVSDDVLQTFKAAFESHKRMGGIVLRESLGDEQFKRLTTRPISSTFLIKFAQSVSGEVGRTLNEVPLEPEQGKTGHQIASDITVVQLLGLTATKALEG